jgi:hypothetical protein
MPAILAPDDQPDAGGGSVAERHRRAVLGFHPPRAGRDDAQLGWS